MDMQSSLQTEYIGSKYTLLEFYLYKDDSGADFYVDAVHIGKTPTTNDENGTQLDSSFDFGLPLSFCRTFHMFYMRALFYLLNLILTCDSRTMQTFILCFPAAVLHKRRPPPFESSGFSFDVIVVNKTTSNDSQISYKIKATPTDCAFGFPLLGVGFLQVTDKLNLYNGVTLKTSELKTLIRICPV